MRIDPKKKSVAPEDIGEMPNEYRCKQCWTLLSQVITSEGEKPVLWCIKCNLPRTG